MGIAHVLVWVAASYGFAEPAADEPASPPVDFYLSSMLAARQQLRSCEFVVTGTKSVKNTARPELDYSGKILIFGARDQSRIRMDNLEPVNFSDPANPSKMKLRWIERKFYRTPRVCVSWMRKEGENEISIFKPAVELTGPFLFFDVRGLGLMTWEHLNDKRGPEIEARIAALKRSHRDKSVDTSDPKHVQLVFLLDVASRSEELRYWLRPDQGFAPVRLEVRTRTLDADDDGWRVTERAETSWEQTGDVWLPVRFEMTQTDKAAEQRLAWKIRWRSVNKALDERLFDWQDFAATETVNVVDRRENAGILMQIGPVRKPGFMDERQN